MCGCRRLKEATGRLVVAWVLASACLTGHLAHLWKGAPAWLHLFGRPSVHAAMSALALMGVYLHSCSYLPFDVASIFPLPLVLPIALLCFCPALFLPFLLPSPYFAFALLCSCPFFCLDPSLPSASACLGSACLGSACLGPACLGSACPDSARLWSFQAAVDVLHRTMKQLSTCQYLSCQSCCAALNLILGC